MDLRGVVDAENLDGATLANVELMFFANVASMRLIELPSSK